MLHTKNCHFCTASFKYLDYKDTDQLHKFLDPHARILNRRRSGVCAKHQRELSTAVKRARFLALLPFIAR
ncbi:MAG: 30S ribosomal protein S18 [Patescibacteria group bacterium]